MSAHRRNGSIAQFPSEILRNTCAQAVEDYKFVCSSREENVKLEGELREIYFKYDLLYLLHFHYPLKR